jgi:HSP20 family protein
MTAQSATAMQPTKASVPVRQSSGDLSEQFERIYDLISRRAYELFEGNGQWPGHDLDDWLRAESELLHPVYMEITESDGDIVVRAEVPGFSARDLEIKVESRCLRIVGKREVKEEQNAKKIRSEWCGDEILRAVDLPADVDTARASAGLKDGILTIDLPKAPHAKAIRVEPKSA